MNTLNHDDRLPADSVDEDSQVSGLMRQLVVAQKINRHARALLHADTHSDAAHKILERIRQITGMEALSIFTKQAGEDDVMRFEWCCRTGNGSGTDDAPEWFSLTSAMCERLAVKKPFRAAMASTGGTDTSDSRDECVPIDLIIPINVFGTWWGGLCLDGGPTEVGEETPVFESLVTAADFLGVYFERQIASRESTESDKLAGALEMAGTVCHKLNQPMQVILGYASMVTSGDISDPDQVCDIVKMIEDETRRMGIITKNLMGITQYRTVETPEVGSMCDVDGPMPIR